jgi:hypothetical protein
VPVISHIKKVEIVTMPTLTKSCIIKIVANSKRGRFNKKKIFWCAISSEPLYFSRSSGLSEKKATSEADTIADTNNKTMINEKPTI